MPFLVSFSLITQTKTNDLKSCQFNMKSELSESDSKLDFESVLFSEMGSFGKYQIINLLLLAIPGLISGLMAGEYIFSASRLPHRCEIPECEGINPEFIPSWIYEAIPKTTTGFDECYRYESNKNATDNILLTLGHCSAYLFDRNKTRPCENFVYQRTNSVVYDFNLECNEWLRALAGTLNSMGAMIALPLAGFISDHFGRRSSIVFFSFNVALTGFIRSFSVNYSMYAVLQFMQTALGGGVFSAAYILATEIVGPKYRVMTSAIMSSMFALGQVILGLTALIIYEWRHLSLVLFTPVFFLVTYKWLITESPRWLLSKNKRDRAKTTLERASRLNNRCITGTSMNYLLTAIQEQLKVNKDQNKGNLFYKVLKSSIMLRRCIITPVMWIATTFIYYGLSINSVSLSGNMYFNYIATAAIEIPGFWTAVLVLDKIGRRTALFTGYMACGVCCIGFAFTSKQMYGLSLFLFLSGKYCIGLVITSVYLYTAELYPTRHRHSFLGFSSMLGRIGSIVSPLTPPLMVYWTGIPSIMFGCMAIISGLLVLTQPETLGLKVPDTFEDAERLGTKINSK